MYTSRSIPLGGAAASLELPLDGVVDGGARAALFVVPLPPSVPFEVPLPLCCSNLLPVAAGVAVGSVLPVGVVPGFVLTALPALPVLFAALVLIVVLSALPSVLGVGVTTIG